MYLRIFNESSFYQNIAIVNDIKETEKQIEIWSPYYDLSKVFINLIIS